MSPSDAGSTEEIALSGEIDLARSPQVREQLLNAASSHPQELRVNMSEVTYIDSSGLAALIEAYQAMVPHEGKIILVGLRERVRTIFQIARLDQVFEIRD